MDRRGVFTFHSMGRASNWNRVGEIGPAGRKEGQDFPSSFFF